MSDREESPDGSVIYRHQQMAPGDGSVDHADDTRIEAHLDRVHGGQRVVFHEIVSERVHVDVHILAPTEQHPYYLVATSGMSAKPMNVPREMPDRDQWRYAELCMILPPEWTPSREAFTDERMYWPVRLLKRLARMPHEYSTWLGWGHTIPNGDPAVPYAPDTALVGAVLVPPYLLGEALFVLPGEPTIHMFYVLPLTAAEMDYKLQVGLDELLTRLEEKFPRDIYGPLNPLRQSAV